jgi:hypothetical protein
MQDTRDPVTVKLLAIRNGMLFGKEELEFPASDLELPVEEFIDLHFLPALTVLYNSLKELN